MAAGSAMAEGVREGIRKSQSVSNSKSNTPSRRASQQHPHPISAQHESKTASSSSSPVASSNDNESVVSQQSSSCGETRSSCPEVDTFVSSLTGLSSNRDIGMMSKDEIIGLLYNEAIRFKERSEELESQLDQTLQERDQAHIRTRSANDKLSRSKTDHKTRQKRLTDEQQMMQKSLNEAVAINQELHKSRVDQMTEKQVLLFRLDAQEGTIGFLRRKIGELSALINNRPPSLPGGSTTESVSATEKSTKAASVAVSAATSVHSPSQMSVHNHIPSSSSSAALTTLTDASGFASDMRVKMEQRRNKRNGLISRMNSVGSGLSGVDKKSKSRSSGSTRSGSSGSSSSYKSTGLTEEDMANATNVTPNVNSVAADDGSSQTENMRRQFSRHSSIQHALSFFANNDRDGGRGVNLEKGGKMNMSQASDDDVISVISILSDIKDCDSVSTRGPPNIPSDKQKFKSQGPRAA
jgi:hypothetical protein